LQQRPGKNSCNRFERENTNHPSPREFQVGCPVLIFLRKSGSQELINPDQVLLKALKEKGKEENPNLVELEAGNHKKVTYLKITKSDAESSSQRSRTNSEIFEAMSVQGNVESRLKEFVHHPEVKRVCIEEHALPCKLGVQASTDFRIAGAFTKSQFQMVRSIGVEMANEEQINAEMEARQVELEHKQVMLEVKIKDPTSDKHIVSKVNISIFFHVFVFVLFLVVSLFEKKKKN